VYADDRYAMRGIAGEAQVVVAVVLLEGAHVLRFHGLVNAIAVAQLPVDGPKLVGLAATRHRGAAVPGRVEPGAVLGRVLAVQQDAADDMTAHSADVLLGGQGAAARILATVYLAVSLTSLH